MPVLKYRPNVGSPWQVVGITGQKQVVGMFPQIIVTAPTGSTVTCTKGSTVLNAEEVDDTWTFNVTEYGEWEIKSIGTSGSITKLRCKVDTVKRYTVTLFEQIVNYKMLYEPGEEHIEETGGWAFNSSNSAVSNKTDSCIEILGGSPSWGNAYTINPIALDGYNNAYFISKAVQGSYSAQAYFFTALAFTSTAPKIVDAENPGSATSYYLQNKGAYEKAIKCLSLSVTGSLYPCFASKQVNSYFYALFLTKPDDWATLCEMAGLTPPSTLSKLIANSDMLNAILSDGKATSYMVSRCTGDFMAAAIASTTFLTVLAASANKEMVYANPHWAKFLAMVQ